MLAVKSCVFYGVASITVLAVQIQKKNCETEKLLLEEGSNYNYPVLIIIV